jgi:hypothetical protein
MKVLRLIFALSILSCSNHLFGQISEVKFNRSDSVFVFNPQLDLKIKQRMRDSAFANASTAPNFIVIIASDQNGRITKEICTEAPFVEGGIDRNKGNEKVQKYNHSHFYFNTKEALDNIGFNEYSYDELLEYGKSQELKEILAQVQNSDKNIEVNFQGTRKEQFMFAHILFNNGIMSTRGCIAGNFMVLRKMK